MKGKSATPDPYLTDHGEALVAVTPGEDGEILKITDRKAIGELRELIATRRDIGRKISAKLAEHGMISAASIDATHVDKGPN